MRSTIMSLVLVAFGPVLAAGTTTLVSKSSVGVQGNNSSYGPSITPDGRYVAFVSFADNLVPGDAGRDWDTFLHDRATGITERLSLTSSGAEPDASCMAPALTDDGRFSSFVSSATNLVPGDTNGFSDVFVRDRLTGTIVLASVSSSGAQANSSCVGAISGNGRFVSFVSDADNLVPGDTNRKFDVFVRDLLLGTTVRVSVSSPGTQANDDCYAASLSDNGRFCTFSSRASNLGYDPSDRWDNKMFPWQWELSNTRDGDVFLHDRDPDQNGVFDEGNGVTDVVSSYVFMGRFPVISGDGCCVAFQGYAFWRGTAVDVDLQVFVQDRCRGQTEIVSVTNDGELAEGDSYPVALSRDGRMVLFVSYDRLGQGDFNNAEDLYVHDRWLHTTTRVNVREDGTQANQGASVGGISADGSVIAFASQATDLVPGDTNSADDVFVRDRSCPEPRSTRAGDGWPGSHGTPDLAASAPPALCQSIDLVVANSRGTRTPAMLLLGTQPADLVTNLGGTLWLVPQVLVAIDLPATGLVVTTEIPCSPSLCGSTAYAQVLELDPGASQGVSFTDAIALEFGT